MLSGVYAQAAHGNETAAAAPAGTGASAEIAVAPADSANAGDTLKVSLLTCSPGEKVYELYGHTALRVYREGQRGYDWVFNYGSFSFDQPGFVWRFVRGTPDYELSVVPFLLFVDAYARQGRAVTELVLNFTPEEARRLENALAENLQEGNRTYRYNIFYDNCVTRAVAQIEKAVEGRIVWPEADKQLTLRNIVHEFSDVSPWNRFGQDLLVGCEADRPADLKAQMFAPLYAEKFVEGAKIVNKDGTVRPLTAGSMRVALTPTAAPAAEKPFTPFVLMMLLLTMTASCLIYGYRRRCVVWQWTAVLMAAQGLAGCVVAFLFFFSSHPTVGGNWLVLVLNPLPLLYLPWYMKHASMGRTDKVVKAYGYVVLGATVVINLFHLQEVPDELNWFVLCLYLMTSGLLARPLLKKKASAQA